MFICDGEKIYPGDVETLLERHPKILEAAVVSVDDETKGAVPIAFVVKAPQQSSAPMKLRPSLSSTAQPLVILVRSSFWIKCRWMVRIESTKTSLRTRAIAHANAGDR
jgi:acyl-CoA synthetase (AMP-forming)/AMP-acid ligase II